MSFRRHIIAILVAVVCFILDIATKTWARANLSWNESAPFYPSVCKYHLITNTGAAFSLGHNYAPLVLVISAVVILILLGWSIKRHYLSENPFLEELGIAIVIGAAFGNLFERCYRGHVTDFLEFTFVPFPVFNLADALIDVGIGLIFIAMLKKQQK